MGDIFQEKADRDLFFSTFATDIGSQLDQLKFEFEEIESGKTQTVQEIIAEDTTDGRSRKITTDTTGSRSPLEDKVQNEIEKNLSDVENSDKDHKSRTRTYTQTMQRAFSTVSLMTNFKTGFWRRKNRGSKKNSEVPKGRRSSTSSTPETNNNHDLPKIKISGENEGRTTIYSTVPRQPKTINKSRTLSPSRTRLASDDGMPQQLERSESGNVFVPPVIMDGEVVYDYQYATPELSPKQPNEGKFYRRNSLSRLLRIRKSPKKSPKKHTTPIKQLYEKTVLTASAEEMNKIGVNGKPVENGTKKATTNGLKSPANGKANHGTEHPQQLKAN